MKNSCLAIFAVLVTALSCEARLGEDEDGCRIRYGTPKLNAYDKSLPLIPGFPSRTYHYQNYVVRIGFVNGLASRIDIRRNSGALTNDDVAAILRANTGVTTNFGWTGRFGEWVRGDGATAHIESFSRTSMQLQSKQLTDLLISQTKKKEEARRPIPGF